MSEGSQKKVLRRKARRRLRQVAKRAGLLSFVGAQESRRARYAEARERSVLKNTVLFEAYAGRGVLCNPAGIFDELVRNADYSHLELVWAVADPQAVQKRLASRVPKDRRVKFIRFKSPVYYDYLARAGYLVNNVTFPPEFNKRPDQTYINTWHGTPLKAMGYEVPNGEHLSRNVIRNFLHADYLLSSGPYMTQLMYRQSYPIDGIFDGTVLESGSPRVNAQLSIAGSSAETRRALLRSVGIEVGEKSRVLLFAPTWRGAATFQPEDQSSALRAVVLELNQRLERHNILVALKPHQLAQKFLEQVPDLNGLLVDSHANVNEVLGAVDGLITDYSSIAFDFLAQEAPIFWYTPDAEDYAHKHGLVVEPKSLFGHNSTSVDTLTAHIVDEFVNDGDMRSRQSEQWSADRTRYAPREGATPTQALVDRVFGGKPSEDLNEVSLSSAKTRVLFYAGGLERNGVTASAISLLSALDPDRYDVTVIKGERNDQSTAEALVRLRPHARVLGRIGGLAIRRRDQLRWRYLFRSRPTAMVTDPQISEYMRLESQRLLGHGTFDVVIDFSGYTPFWQGVLLNTPARRRLVWQHNDLAKEVSKVVNGVAPHQKNLPAVFSLYEFWDGVYAVSDALAAVNEENLADFLGDKTIGAVPNLVDIDGLKELSTPITVTLDGAEATRLVQTDVGLEAAFVRLTSSVTRERLEVALRRARLLHALDADNTSPFVFVTAGRFSPEKNHRRMLEAFAKVHRAEPNTVLMVCGTGPLHSETVRLSGELGVANSVVFPGHVYDLPFLLTQADCFVLSSDHEGQPVVILEALALGVPSVVTAFDSVAGLPETPEITVVPRSADELADAMLEEVRRTDTRPHMDMVAYNQTALQRFEEAVIGEVVGASAEKELGLI